MFESIERRIHKKKNQKEERQKIMPDCDTHEDNATVCLSMHGDVGDQWV